jgi:glycosyltransferase involved in cell wall biosynthesis
MKVARRMGVSDRVRHIGYVEHETVPVLYRAARALVFPSLYEGFGGPPLEAMACGCPVASSLRASLSELVGGACVELDPEVSESIATAIERVVGDEPLRERLVEAGLERARQYSWHDAAKSHVAVYSRALEAGG